MWRDTYAILAEEYMVAQQSLAESLARTARWAAIRRADQLAAGRRRQERRDKRDRASDLNCRIRQMVNPRAILSGTVDLPTDSELAEFEQLQADIPELDDFERLNAARTQPNPEAQRAIQRLQLRRGRALLGLPSGGCQSGTSVSERRFRSSASCGTSREEAVTTLQRGWRYR
jgi:hypothetical protein